MTGARRNLAAAFLLAATFHGAALAWVLSQPKPSLRVRPPRPPTTVRLVERPRPPPAPAPEPPPPGRVKETPAPRAVARTEPRAPAPAAAPAPAPPQAAPPEPAPQPRRFAVSMDAVVPGGAGGVAVPTTEGRTAARGDPTLPSSAPVGDNTAPPPPADVTEVERAPRPRRLPSSADVRAFYPPRALEQGLEADVAVELLVSEAGAVVDVRLARRAGDGFDEAALSALRAGRERFLYEPARRGGRPVAVWIPFTVKFRLDG